jgi:pSer/pThr/pTyr-binding forkhead associated (FHA) protein
VPLAEASLRVNGRDLAVAVGLKPGDRLEVGQSVVTVDAVLVDPPEAEEWHLLRGRRRRAPLPGRRLRCRAWCDNELVIDDDHISRSHARLCHHQGLIWLQDLGSSNGSYVNGERLIGACRLFHGDEVRFDTVTFQLIGRGADLTPVRQAGAASNPLPLSTRVMDGADRGIDTTEFAVVEELPPVTPVLPAGEEAGAFLLGASDPVAGMTFRTPMGRTLVGRHEDCDLVIRDRTVSARHAELMVRAEGVTVTNLMATNGTRLNGEEVQTGRLQDGDVLRFGRVSLVFKDVRPSADNRPWLRHAQIALLVASLILAIGLVFYLV